MVERHTATVRRFFQRRVGPEADDLTQRTLLAAVEGRDRIKSSGDFRAFLLGIARHEYVRSVRRADRTPRFPDDPPTPPFFILQRLQDRRRLAIALRQLPLHLQLTVALFYWEEMTTREVARTLGIAHGTAKWRLFAARDSLAATIASLPSGGFTPSDELDRWASWILGRIGARSEAAATG